MSLSNGIFYIMIGYILGIIVYQLLYWPRRGKILHMYRMCMIKAHNAYPPQPRTTYDVNSPKQVCDDCGGDTVETTNNVHI